MKRIQVTITAALLGILFTHVNVYANGRNNFIIRSHTRTIVEQRANPNFGADIIGATLIGATIGGVIGTIMGVDSYPRYRVRHEPVHDYAPSVSYIALRYPPPPRIYYERVDEYYRGGRRYNKFYMRQRHHRHNRACSSRYSRRHGRHHNHRSHRYSDY